MKKIAQVFGAKGCFSAEQPEGYVRNVTDLSEVNGVWESAGSKNLIRLRLTLEIDSDKNPPLVLTANGIASDDAHMSDDEGKDDLTKMIYKKKDDAASFAVDFGDFWAVFTKKNIGSIQRKIQKNGAALALVAKLGAIAFGIAVAAQVFLVAYMQITQKMSFGDGGSIFSLFDGEAKTVGDVTVQFAGQIFSQIFLIAILCTASAIFKDFAAQHSPFYYAQIARLKKIARLMLAFVFVPPLVQIILTPFFASPDAYFARFEPAYIIFPLLFYCLAQVFEYGKLLQQESDETL